MPDADGPSDPPSRGTRDIPRWTQAYARNRVLLDQFEGELAATPSSPWGEIRAAGTRLTVLHASHWLVVLPLFLWLARMEHGAGNEAWPIIWYAAAMGGILTLIAAWARRRGDRLPANSVCRQLPIVEYARAGLLGVFVAHAYGRWALRKLSALA